MRIAVVTETFYPFKGGSAKRYLEVFKRIVRKGHRVDLYTARLNPDWELHENIYGIEVYRSKKVYKNFITKDGFRSLSPVIEFSMWAFHRIFEDGDYDLLEANHCPIFPAIGTWIYSKLKAQPLVMTFHEAWYNDWYNFVPKRIYAPFGIALERISVKLPDMIIAVSNTTAKRLIRYFNIPYERIKVISNGVDLQLYDRVKVDKEQTKLIYAGRLNPHKKIDWLIEAYQLVREKYPELKLEIVGDGPLFEYYKNYVMNNGLKDCINLYGAVDDLEFVKLLKSSWIYVLPSIREGQSITVLEAMAAGTPQVVVDVEGSGAGELVSLSGSGIAVSPSSKSIAEGILSILSDQELWERLRLNGLNFIKDYTWDKVAEDYLNVYNQLCKR
ncbi:MAG: glycosyltransferase family 4 protein [Nitrososphaerota archaeon]|nr:glycosyltransferase family 4 protein [Nitrososphaerota archaeon]